MSWHVATMDGGVLHTAATRKAARAWVDSQAALPVKRTVIRQRFVELQVGSTTYYLGDTDEMQAEGFVTKQSEDTITYTETVEDIFKGLGPNPLREAKKAQRKAGKLKGSTPHGAAVRRTVPGWDGMPMAATITCQTYENYVLSVQGVVYAAARKPLPHCEFCGEVPSLVQTWLECEAAPDHKHHCRDLLVMVTAD